MTDCLVMGVTRRDLLQLAVCEFSSLAAFPPSFAGANATAFQLGCDTYVTWIDAQFHFFMLISTHPSLLHFPHPSPLHFFTLNSKLTFLVNPFRHRSLTVYTPD